MLTTPAGSPPPLSGLTWPGRTAWLTVARLPPCTLTWSDWDWAWRRVVQPSAAGAVLQAHLQPPQLR
eukprot:1462121-Pyramimonas_sp.AAC.1